MLYEVITQQTAVQEIADGGARVAGLSSDNLAQIDTMLVSLNQASAVLDKRVEDFAGMNTARTIIEVAKNDHVRFKRQVVDRLLERDAQTADTLSDHLSCRLRITSYNVCYTKLLRTPEIVRAWVSTFWRSVSSCAMPRM